VSTLQTHLEEYLRLRRALGFELVWPGHVLPQFLIWLEDTGSQTLTTEAAISWARLSTTATPMTMSHRLGAVRGFARYLRTIDPTTEVPPTGVFGRQRRITPYIYSPDEIGRLVQAARGLHPPLRAATHEALLGLLGASGMRVGEALRLRCEDVDLAAGVIRVRHCKFDRERLVPLHPTTTEALRGYTVRRDRLCPQPNTDAFFVSTVGSALRYEGVRSAFGVVLVSAGFPITPGAHPRIHDLRHKVDGWVMRPVVVFPLVGAAPVVSVSA
jgi:integrase/recombinase XerD